MNGGNHTAQSYDESGALMSEIDKALIEAQRTSLGGGVHGYQFKGNDGESEDEGFNHYPRVGRDQTLSRQPVNGSSRVDGLMEQSTVSESDSADGYDSFENTNNKKKRKIPISGSFGAHSTSLSSDLANMGITPGHAVDVNNDADQLEFADGEELSNESTVASMNGYSGSGRGHFGPTHNRHLSRRNPLGVSANGVNAQNGRTNYRRDFGQLNGSKDQGIISAAIANAASMPTPISKGQENMSLVQRQLAAKKAAPAKTQFTFTCESDNHKDVVWPGEASTASHLIPPAQPNPPPSIPQPHYQDTKPVNTTGTQTSPSMTTQAKQTLSSPPNTTQRPSVQPSAQPPAQLPAQPPKPRRSAAKRYAIAARDRQIQQQHDNKYHHPKEEDQWICQFCEYEAIFGSPPEALVREYEIKDRRERKRLAEKRRLLEKAKMKAKKGRKGAKGKGGGASANANPHIANHSAGAASQQQSQAFSGESQLPHHSAQYDGEEFADEYNDDPLDMPDLEEPPLTKAQQSKIPQPVGGGSGRKAHDYPPGLTGSSTGMGTTQAAY